MSNKIKIPDLEALRLRLKDGLPDRIGKALNDYEAFHDEQPPADAKGFAAHQAACRTALAHIDMLTKLLRWAEGEETVSPDGEAPDMGALIAKARAAVNGLDDNDDEDDEDD